MANVPIVFANGTLPCPNVTSILCDDRDGIAQCVNHLYQRGHTRIIYVNDNHTDSARRKLTGYQTALYERGIHENAVVLETESSFDGGIAVGEKIAAEYRPGIDYTAIIFPEDLTALGCIRALTAHGISVPEDVAVTGYGATMFRIVAPQDLTTVDTHLGMLGSESVRCICARLNDMPCPNQMILTPELLCGETT